ncbi:MAG: MoaD/ThiS family protein [Gammaproteobacteria bacterium]
MPIVEMTRHLYRFFPQLENRTITVPAGSVAEILCAVNEIAPGFTDYVLDEHGALCRHVNLCINDTILIDKKHSLIVSRMMGLFIFSRP